MSATKHTPGPLHLGDGKRAMIVYRADGYAVADCKTFHGRISQDEAEANAAFIVRACNSHEALVAALKACMIRLVQVDERFRAHTGAEPAGELGEITRAKAALKMLDD